MKFVITRASRDLIGSDYKLIRQWQHDNNYHKPVEYGIVEIQSLEELPQEKFVLSWSVDAYACVPDEISIGDIDGQITLYDDYLE